jgi:tetratricopeptide (TPR) repeat protein
VLDDLARLGQVYVGLTNYYWQTGDHDHAVETGQRALVIAAELGDPVLEITTSLRLGQTHRMLGDYRRAITYLQRCIEAIGDELADKPLGQQMLPSTSSRSWVGFCSAELGQFDEGIAVVEEGIRIAEALNRPIDRVGIYWAMGTLHFRRGHLEDARTILERALELARTWQIRYLLISISGEVGYAYAQTGRVAEAIPLLESVVDETTATGFISHIAFPRLWLGEAYLLADRHEDAARMAVRALEHVRSYRERGHEAWALRLIAQIAAQAGETAQCETYYREAVGLAEELGMRPLAAHCRLGLGTLYQKVGRDEQALPELSTAGEMYRAMDMPFWLEKAEAALGQVPPG